MQLSEILKDIYTDKLNRTVEHWEIQSLSCDSRKVHKDSLFVALKGLSKDGTEFIDVAIDKGARVIVTSKSMEPESLKHGICYLQTQDTNRFLRDIAKRFYGNPSRQVRTIGVTGTNGKTTVTYLLESILKQSNCKTTVIGTINTRIGNDVYPSQNTTPGFLDNQEILSESLRKGIDHCVMEVSSHALDQGRVDLIDFKMGVFTNLASDHLDYHKNRENYFAAKSRLFTELLPDTCAVINADDLHGQKLITMTRAKVLTFGIERPADFRAKDIKLDISGTTFTVVSKRGEHKVRTRLIGRHNVYNILAAFAAAVAEGIDLDSILKGIERLEHIPGRLERVDCQQPFSIFIDFAHTQDALENVLKTIRQTSHSRILLLFGCGGDRDKTKRPVMGKTAGRLADFSIVTSDNSRSEEPQAIIDQITAGFEKNNYLVIENREEAIHKALSTAQAGDIVLIAGKGHETYQIFKDKTIPFDERKIIRQFFNVNNR